MSSSKSNGNDDENKFILQEIDTEKENEQTTTIQVEDYMMNKQTYKESVVQILSNYIDVDTAKLIYDVCNNDKILIPNTFDKDELLKYWYVVNKGGMNNNFRDYHRVELYPSSHLQFTQRGMLSTVKGYKVKSDSKYKLKFECKYIMKDSTDFMIFALKSSGVRREGILFEYFGHLESVGSELWIGMEHQNNNIGFGVKTEDTMVMESGESVGKIPLNEELTVIMIDDGNKVNVEYYIKDKLMAELSTNSTQDAAYNRICFCNREDFGNICDITYLQLSIIQS